MDDKNIIELLNKIVNEKMLDDISIDNAHMCIDILINGGMENINNVKMMAMILIKRAGLIQTNNNENVVDNSEEKIIARATKFIKEIKSFLDTKDLTPYLIEELEYILDGLTKTETTPRELNRLCSLYENKYRPAITISDEYIPETSNHKR